MPETSTEQDVFAARDAFNMFSLLVRQEVLNLKHIRNMILVVRTFVGILITLGVCKNSFKPFNLQYAGMFHT